MTAGYPNDVPVKSYDFQAPLGEFGHRARIVSQTQGASTIFLNDVRAGSGTDVCARAPRAVPEDQKIRPISA